MARTSPERLLAFALKRRVFRAADWVRLAVRAASVVAFASIAGGAADLAAHEKPSSAPAPAQTEPPDYTKLSLEELMKIKVTTVSRTESTVGRSPAAVFVITREMIRRSGATVLPELFRMVPGMDVARIDGNKWAVSVRGFNQRFGDKLLVQVDGRTVYNPLFSGVYWDAVDYPLEDIERVEVIRGPGASVWGANAVNGIINVITRRAKDTQDGLLSGAGGTEEHGFGTVRYGGKGGDKLQYRVYGKGFTRGEQFSRAGDPNDRWWGVSGGLLLDGQVSERDSVTLRGDFLSSEAGRKDLRPMAAAPFVFTNVETEVTHAGNVFARWSRELDNDSRWALRAYWDHVGRKGDKGFVDLRWTTFDVDFQHQFPLGHREKIVYGLGYRHVGAFLGPSTSDGGFAVSFPPPDRRSRLVSAFAEDQIALVERKLVLTLGSKLEHNDFTGFEVQPTARLLWTPTERQSIWAAVSRAVRTPNLSEDGIGTRQLPVSTAPAVFPRLASSPDFETEQLRAYELGYRAQATDSLSGDVALFYNVYHKLRVAVPGALKPGSAPGTFDLPLTFQNRMKGETHGAELDTTWQPADWWRLYGAHTLLKVTLHADPSLSAGTRSSSEAMEGQSPRQQVYLQSSWDLPRRVQLDLIGRFVGRLHGFNPSGVGGGDVINSYSSLDVRLGSRPRKNLELAVVGQNLLDSHHPETGTAQFLRSAPVEIRRGGYGKVTIWW